MASKETKLNIIVDARNRTEKALGQVQQNLKNVGEQNKNISAAFSKMAKTGAVAFAALSVASQKLVRDSAASLQIEESFRRMTEQAGISADKLVEQLQKTSAGTVSATNLMLSANRAMALGVGQDMSTMTQLMEVARLKGRALGLDTTQAFNDIVTGIGRGSPLILDNLGITIKLGEAQEMYAQKLGKTSAQLTDAEKKQALLNAVLEQGNKEVAAAGTLSKTAAEKIQEMKASFADAADELGRALIPAATKLLETITPIIKRVGDWIAQNPQLTANLVKLALAVAGLVTVVGTLGLAVGALIKSFAVLGGAILLLSGPVGWILAGFAAVATVIYKVMRAQRDLSTQTFTLTEQVQGMMTPLHGATTSSEAFSGALQGVSSNAGGAAEALENLQKQARGVFEEVFKEEADSKRDLAEAIVAQEEKVSDIKREIRSKERDLKNEESDATRRSLRRELDDLTDKLEQEKTALASAANLKTRLRAEISEAERRADLTDFERTVEDIQKRRIERLKDQVIRLQEIQAEIAAEKGKNASIQQSYVEAQDVIRLSAQETTDQICTLAEKAGREIKRNILDKLKDAASWGYGNTIGRFTLQGRASGGPVTSSTPYIVGEKGPELFVPSSSGQIIPNSAMGGSQIIITGNTFMSDEDAAEKVGDMIMSRLKLSNAI